MEKFKAGDIVLLKSGSPAMTVTKVLEGTPEPKEVTRAPAWGEGQGVLKPSVTCQWFDGKRPLERDFLPEALIKVSTEKE